MHATRSQFRFASGSAWIRIAAALVLLAGSKSMYESLGIDGRDMLRFRELRHDFEVAILTPTALLFFGLVLPPRRRFIMMRTLLAIFHGAAAVLGAWYCYREAPRAIVGHIMLPPTIPDVTLFAMVISFGWICASFSWMLWALELMEEPK